MTAELAVQRQSLLTCWIGCPERNYDCELWSNSTEGWLVDCRSAICGYELKDRKGGGDLLGSFGKYGMRA